MILGLAVVVVGAGLLVTSDAGEIDMVYGFGGGTAATR
jgi:hypothetical protein